MKRFISIILLFSFIMLGTSSCGMEDKIKYIEVDETKYYPVYMYSFRDAMISKNYTKFSETEDPTECGYVLSREKLEVGDEITVWTNIHFKDNENDWFSSDHLGVTAMVDKVVKVYSLKAERKSDVYVLTYYNRSSMASTITSSDRSTLESELETIKAEVCAERVIVYYNAD